MADSVQQISALSHEQGGGEFILQSPTVWYIQLFQGIVGLHQIYGIAAVRFGVQDADLEVRAGVHRDYGQPLRRIQLIDGLGIHIEPV